MLAEVMGSLQSTLNYLPAHEAYELARTVRERTVAQLKVNEQWHTPELPEECYFYHCNHLGLPEALTNQNGEAVWAASYDAWGNIKTEHNPNSLNQPIRLPGQYHDIETGLYYNRHRYYDPKLGNYINQDPIGLASGEPNLMAYPRNPVQGVDPLGLELCCKKTKCPAFSGEGLSDISKEAMQEINKITNAGKALSVIVPGFDMMSAFISKDASGAVEALWNISSHDTENTVNAVRAIPKIIRGRIEEVAVLAELELRMENGSREEIKIWEMIATGECKP